MIKGGSRIFLRRGAPLRNDLTDGSREQIFKANQEDKGLFVQNRKLRGSTGCSVISIKDFAGSTM